MIVVILTCGEGLSLGHYIGITILISLQFCYLA